MHVCTRPPQTNGGQFYVPFRFVIWKFMHASYNMRYAHLAWNAGARRCTWSDCSGVAILHACNFPTLGYILYNIYCHVVLVQDQQTAMVLENLASMVKKEEETWEKNLTNFHMHACMHIFPKWETQAHMACMYTFAGVWWKRWISKGGCRGESEVHFHACIFCEIMLTMKSMHMFTHVEFACIKPFMHHACMHSGRMIWMKLQSEKKGMTGVSSKGSTNCTKRTQRCL